eukprot:TRINITY_DN6150_c0_g1_i1.p1 TRINITY_DN6150_c0_g1~~TRINITY_DN6150_c0_g1_i1.p1  ORF type:complete len:502 (+),score=124.63 TRINITY_DN6150_c0_g1_i1:102-1607(+)
MDWMGSLRSSFADMASTAKSAVDETVSDFKQKGVGGVFRESAAEVAEGWRDVSEVAASTFSGAAREARRSIDATTSWAFGSNDDGPTQSSSSSSSRTAAGAGARGAAKAPRERPRPPPRLEDLRKGDKVYRRGEPAEIVKVDYEVDPPSLVVRMLDDGREVGTTGGHVSLRDESSRRCIDVGVAVLLVGLKGRADLNGRRGVIVGYRRDLGRWDVRLTRTAAEGSDETVCARPCSISVLLAGVTTEPPAPAVPPEPASVEDPEPELLSAEFESSCAATSGSPAGASASASASAEATALATPPSAAAGEPERDAACQQAAESTLPSSEPRAEVGVLGASASAAEHTSAATPAACADSSAKAPARLDFAPASRVTGADSEASEACLAAPAAAPLDQSARGEEPASASEVAARPMLGEKNATLDTNIASASLSEDNENAHVSAACPSSEGVSTSVEAASANSAFAGSGSSAASLPTSVPAEEVAKASSQATSAPADMEPPSSPG